ncbi:MAG TPA: MarR family transcriptional regulator [Streptosporangiaceae bacterium]
MTAADGGSDQIDQEILDSMAELIGSLLGRAEGIARRLGVPGVFLKALHRLDCPMAMKDLGQRMHCDPSFVTSVADMLEQRGLATRESDPADRRVKRIALTAAGLELKQRVENEVLASMPWRQALDASERAQLLGFIRKMLAAQAAGPGPEPGPSNWEEVSEVLVSTPVSGVDG